MKIQYTNKTLEDIEKEKPHFYIMDLNNYTSDFLIEIIDWQDLKIHKLQDDILNGGIEISGDKPKKLLITEAKELIKEKIEKDKEIKDQGKNKMLVAREWWYKFFKEFSETGKLIDNDLESMRRKMFTADGKPKCIYCGKSYVNEIDAHTGEVSEYLWRPSCEHLGKGFTLCVG